jgi:hypothetical protein
VSVFPPPPFLPDDGEPKKLENTEYKDGKPFVVDVLAVVPAIPVRPLAAIALAGALSRFRVPLTNTSHPLGLMLPVPEIVRLL